MLEFYEKRRLKRFIFSPLAVALMLAPLLFMGSVAWSAFDKMQITEGNLAEAQADLTALATRRDALQNEIQRLNTPEGLEAEIRSKFNVGREGEKLIVIVDDAEKDAALTPPPKRSFLERVGELVWPW